MHSAKIFSINHPHLIISDFVSSVQVRKIKADRKKAVVGGSLSLQCIYDLSGMEQLKRLDWHHNGDIISRLQARNGKLYRSNYPRSDFKVDVSQLNIPKKQFFV